MFLIAVYGKWLNRYNGSLEIPADCMNITNWIGRTESARDLVTPTPIAALSATFDRNPERPENGVKLPALWHWLYFLPIAQQSEIGPDGHPKRGGFLPPVEQPRRMWAGSQFEFHQPLRVGDAVSRLSTIENITEKSGRTGKLTFVRVRHDISRVNDTPASGANGNSVQVGGELAITEYHDIVYRDMPSPDAPAPKPVAPPDDAQWEHRVDPTDVLLFRFSALTFNGHRIHYDRRYVTTEEGYPGLVVHGPMIAMLLLNAMRNELNDPALTRFEFRAIRPTFDINHFFVCGRPDSNGKTIHLWSKDHENCLTMQATATLA